MLQRLSTISGSKITDDTSVYSEKRLFFGLSQVTPHIFVQNCMYITILRGSCRMMGALLTEKTPTFLIAAPSKWCPPIKIEFHGSGHTRKDADVLLGESAARLPKDECSILLESLTTEDTNVQSLITFEETDSLTISPDLLNQARQIEDQETLLFSGPRRSGKSTAIAGFANYLLSKPGFSQKVFVLDADMGQPDFVLPGFVGLAVLEKHLTSPCLTGIAHINRTPKSNFRVLSQTFLGGLDFSSVDEEAYLAGIAAAYETFRQCSGCILFINSHSLCSDQGTKLTQRILDICQVDRVLLLSADEASEGQLKAGLDATFCAENQADFLRKTRPAMTTYAPGHPTDSQRDLQNQLSFNLRFLRVGTYFNSNFGISNSQPSDLLDDFFSMSCLARLQLKDLELIGNPETDWLDLKHLILIFEADKGELICLAYVKELLLDSQELEVNLPCRLDLLGKPLAIQPFPRLNYIFSKTVL